VTDADGDTTSFAYDGADRKFVTTDPVNRQTEMVYDAAGNVLQEIRGLGSAVQMTYATYTYGADGEKTSVQDADGPTHITQYAYDGFNRAYQTTFPDSTTETIPLTGGYDANSNVLQRISRAGKTFNMTYDVLKRLCTKLVPT
jgi:YD repeat-containing protein